VPHPCNSFSTFGAGILHITIAIYTNIYIFACGAFISQNLRHSIFSLTSIAIPDCIRVYSLMWQGMCEPIEIQIIRAWIPNHPHITFKEVLGAGISIGAFFFIILSITEKLATAVACVWMSFTKDSVYFIEFGRRIPTNINTIGFATILSIIRHDGYPTTSDLLKYIVHICPFSQMFRLLQQSPTV
jgi:hypothetical protein